MQECLMVKLHENDNFIIFEGVRNEKPCLLFIKNGEVNALNNKNDISEDYVPCSHRVIFDFSIITSPALSKCRAELIATFIETMLFFN